MKLNDILNESWVVIDPRGNARPVGSKIQGDRYVKGKRGHYVILAKHAQKARRAIEKAGGNATSRKIQDLMFDLRYEGELKEAKEYRAGDTVKLKTGETVKINQVVKGPRPQFNTYRAKVKGKQVDFDSTDISEGKLNEAPIDKRFAKEFEKSCIALINHLKSEQKDRSNPHGAAGAHKRTVEKMIKNLETVQRYPKLMAHMFGEK